ncbi:MAG: hypothetical protein WCG66_00685 [bacterium]
MKKPFKIPKSLAVAAGSLCIVFLAGVAALAVLSRNLAPVARWTFEKNLPNSKVDVQDIQVTGPGEITFTNFVIHDPVTGRELVRLERGRIVFSLDDLAAWRIGEIHLENPVLLISPGWSGILPSVPEKNGGSALSVRRIVCDFGQAIYDGDQEGKPRVCANFCFDWKNFSAGSSDPFELTLWDVQANAPGSSMPFFVVDLARLRGSPDKMVKNFELHGLEIRGGSLAAGQALAEVTKISDTNANGPAFFWKIGAVDIHDLKTTIGNNPWRSATDAAFTINTTLRHLTPAEITTTVGATTQEIEISDLVIPSPSDPFTRVLSMRSVFVRFTLAGLISRELEDVTILHPVVYIGGDLFDYMEEVKMRLRSAPASSTPDWKIKRFQVKFGNVVIGSGGRQAYGLPLNFRTTAENVALDDLAALKLSGSLEIPAQQYGFPAYQIEISTKPGSLNFSYPPEKGMNNVVGIVRLNTIRWRQFTGNNSWIAATFDRQGINGSFGGTLYGGTIAGGFSFFFEEKSPWIGWISGSGLDLKQLTDIIAPQNFRMTGPLDFTGQVNAESKIIRRLQGRLQTKAPGRMEIRKIDDLLAAVPSGWSSLKRDSLRVALEAARDFDYERGDGDLWFTDGQGILDLKLQGPLGSRTFQTVLHGSESSGGHWTQSPSP